MKICIYVILISNKVYFTVYYKHGLITDPDFSGTFIILNNEYLSDHRQV